MSNGEIASSIHDSLSNQELMQQTSLEISANIQAQLGIQ